MRPSLNINIHKLVSSPALPVLAAILSVFAVFRTAAHRTPWTDLGTPLLVTILWALVVWAALRYTPYIKRLTAKESGLAGAAVVLVTLAWMDFPSSVFAASAAWALLVVIVMSKPSWQLWFNRIGTWWIVATTAILVISSAAGTMGSRDAADAGAPPNLTRTDLPSIYLIIPDRFTSPDGLREFGVDLNPFTLELRSLGFFVPEDMMSSDPITPESRPVPTTRTLRFLVSILNEGRDVPVNIPYNTASRLVKSPETILSLKEMGYEYHNIGSWYAETKAMAIADHNYSYKGYDLMSLMYGSELSVAVLDRSVLRELDASPLMRLSHYGVRRDEHMYQLETTLEVASSPRSKFVMTHLILPHPPFVWNADGGEMPEGLTTEEQYLRQVAFTEGYLLDMVTGIMSRDPGAVILIQADEGVLFTHPPDNKGLTETQWNGVLTAWLVPGVLDEELSELDFTDILWFVRDQAVFWGDQDPA